MEIGLIALVLTLVFLESVGQFLARKYKDNKEKLWMFVLPVFCYIAIVYVLVKTYELENIGFVNALWSGLTLLVVAAMGKFYFEETFSTQDYVAIGFIFIGTILLGTQR